MKLKTILTFYSGVFLGLLTMALCQSAKTYSSDEFVGSDGLPHYK